MSKIKQKQLYDIEVVKADPCINIFQRSDINVPTTTNVCISIEKENIPALISQLKRFI